MSSEQRALKKKKIRAPETTTDVKHFTKETKKMDTRTVIKESSHFSVQMHSIAAFSQHYTIDEDLYNEMVANGDAQTPSVFCFFLKDLLYLFSFDPRYKNIEILCKESDAISVKTFSYFKAYRFPDRITLPRIKYMRNISETLRGESLSNQLRRDYTNAYMSLLNGDLEVYNLADLQLKYEGAFQETIRSADVARVISQFLGHEEALLECSVVVDKYPITRGWYKYGHSMTLVGEYGFHVWNLFRDAKGLYVEIEKVMFHVGKGTMVRLEPVYSVNLVEDLLKIECCAAVGASLGNRCVTTIPRVSFGASSPVE